MALSAELEKPIGAGLLPGCLHTPNRSEIWALVVPVQWLVEHQSDGHLYTDSQYAANGFTMFYLLVSNACGTK